jgi:hypothetical protein
MARFQLTGRGGLADSPGLHDGPTQTEYQTLPKRNY